MRMKTMLGMMSAAAMVVMPVAASAAPARAVAATASARASAVSGESDLAAPGAIIGLILGAVIIGAGVFIAVDDDDSDSN